MAQQIEVEVKSGIIFGDSCEIEVWRLVDPITGKRFRGKLGRFLPRQLVLTETTKENNGT